MTQEFFDTKRITAFEAAYQPIDGLSFGHALVALKEGRLVTRPGWNGKWLDLMEFVDAPEGAQEVEKLPFIRLNRPSGSLAADVHWFPSQADMLANDWKIVE